MSFLLTQDNKDARHVKTYEVALKDKDFVEGPWSQNNLDNGAGLLIPVPAPLGGVIIIGEETIVYCNANATFKAIPIKQVSVSLSINLFSFFSLWFQLCFFISCSLS
jgi:DNA damage-binding protein 1